DGATRRQEGPAPLLVVLAGVFVSCVDVGLVTAQKVSGPGDLFRAVVDAAVALGADAELDLQLEVGGFASAPDQKVVLLQQRGGRDLSDDFPRFSAPVPRVAIPALERFAVEDGYEALVRV